MLYERFFERAYAERRERTTEYTEHTERSKVFQVAEVDDDVPNLLGQVPLEILDFVVDPKRQELIPNPEHGGVRMTEEYWRFLVTAQVAEECRHHRSSTFPSLMFLRSTVRLAASRQQSVSTTKMSR